MLTLCWCMILCLCIVLPNVQMQQETNCTCIGAEILLLDADAEWTLAVPATIVLASDDPPSVAQNCNCKLLWRRHATVGRLMWFQGYANVRTKSCYIAHASWLSPQHDSSGLTSWFNPQSRQNQQAPARWEATQTRACYSHCWVHYCRATSMCVTSSNLRDIIGSLPTAIRKNNRELLHGMLS